MRGSRKSLKRVGIFFNYNYMKRLIVTLVVVFCSVASYAEKKPIRHISIEKSGGKIIKKGPDVGKVGYATVDITETISTEDNKYSLYIRCNGKGTNPCPEEYSISIGEGIDINPQQPHSVSDDITAKICERIDLDETIGSIEIEGVSCTWKNGKKSVNEEGETVYDYQLVITYKSLR